jgi:L-cysteine S-thiosulfotransferase
MKMRIAPIAAGTLAAGALALASCAANRGSDDPEKAAVALMQRDFKPRGQATLDRLQQDEVQKACSEHARDGKLAAGEAERIQRSQLALVRYPQDGRYLGDWKAGEKLAQTGVGKQWSDDPAKPAGGNCYACHQISEAELSYGTIGPSLRHFGRTRGFGPDMQKYVYGKVYDSQAFAACSAMPRFGAHGILTEQQIKDVVALLLDPKSPVNQ